MHSHIGRIAAGLLLAVLAQAQTSRGTVTGTVTDPSEGVVGSASVQLTHIATGVRRRTITNAAGIYRFEAVDLGTYDVKITHAGFNSFVAAGLGVEANRTAVMDVRLELGSEAVTIQVSADAETLAKDGPRFRAPRIPAHPLSSICLLSPSPLPRMRS